MLLRWLCVVKAGGALGSEKLKLETSRSFAQF
jgi:hypothetical protein